MRSFRVRGGAEPDSSYEENPRGKTLERSASENRTRRAPFTRPPSQFFKPGASAAHVPRISPLDVANRLAAVELAAVILAAVVAKIVYLDAYAGYSPDLVPYIGLGLALGFVLHLFYRALNLYEPDTITGSSVRIGKLIGGLLLSFLLLIGTLYLLKSAEFYSRVWMLLWFTGCAFLLVMARILLHRYVRKLMVSGRMRERVAIYGTSQLSNDLVAQLASCHPGLEVAGVYSDTWDPTRHATSLRVRHGLRALVNAGWDGAFSQIIVALPTSEKEAIRAAVEQLAVLPVDLKLYTDVAALPVPVRGCRNLGEAQLHLVMPLPAAERGQLVKLSVDFVLGAIALAMLSPVFLIIALAIKAESSGPVFFRQRRIGQNGSVFHIYKFRTMNVTEDGPVVKQAEKDDCRVTRVGRLLRRTSIDELPQLINVLKGEMSLVGPRPHAVAHDQVYSRQIERFSWRHRVKPGITGWAQVNGCRGEIRNFADMRHRMEHDLYYIDNWSVWLDIEIMFRSVIVVLRGNGAY